MKAICGNKKGPADARKQRRNGLFAMVHIALKDLDISDDDYRDILKNEFRVASASALSIPELGDLVDRFREKGWQPKAGADSKRQREGKQAVALRERAKAMSCELENGDKRLAGLCKRICGVEKLEWCRDAGKLKRLLVVLGKIAEQEGAEAQ